MQGLRILPWVHDKRGKQRKDKHPGWRDYMECDACKRMTAETQREYMRCGWMPTSMRTGPNMHTEIGELDTCPGYLIRLPQVNEAARARMHWEHGSLEHRYDGQEPTGTLLDCIEILVSQISEVESEALYRAQDGA